MTISLKHSFTSPVTDAGNPDEVGPDEWNAEHVLMQADARLLGRNAGSDGATQELTASQAKSLLAIDTSDVSGVSAFMRTVLDDETSNAALTTLTATRSESDATAVPALTVLHYQIDARSFGVTADGTTDDTAAMAAAIAATPTGAILRLPPGRILVTKASGTGIFSITKVIKIYGAGMSITSTGGTAIVIATGTSTSRDLFHIPGVTGNNLRGIEFRQFNVVTQSGAVGRHVFHFDATAGASTNCSEVIIESVYCQALASAGGYSVYLNNTGSVTTQGGFYNSTITRCWLGGGIGSVKTGDTIRVTDNIISTANAAVTIDQVSGAGGFIVARNNVSGTAGGVVITGASAPIIDSNIFEQQATNTEANNSIIDLIGSGSNISSAKIINNQVQSNASVGNPTLVRVAAATGTVIEGNRLATPSAYAPVIITAAAASTYIGGGNTIVGGGTITDAGTNTYRAPQIPGALASGIATWMITPSSANLASALTDETGSGTVVFSSAIREKLAAARTYYVRTDGSDSNTGLADTAGGAFLTIQKAINVVAALDIGTYNVTIQVADGTFTGTIVVTGPWLGSGTVTLQGNNGTPANVLISTGANTSVLVQAGGRLTIKDLKLQATGGGSFLLQATTKGSINFGNLDIGQCTSQQLRAQDNGSITCDSSYTISAGAANHWAATAGGVIRVQSKTITVNNAPRFSGAFASCSIGGVMIVNSNTFSYPTITITSANPGVFTHTAHNKAANDQISFATTGALPTNIVAGTTYYIKTVTDANTYTVSATAGGAEIDCSAGVQSGTHTARAVGSRYAATDNGTIYTAGGSTSAFPGNASGTGTNAGTSPYGLFN